MVDTVRVAVDAGARAVVLREKDLGGDAREALGRELLDVLVPAGGALIVASDLALARRLDAGGVHLAARDELPDATRGPGVIGRSCHDAGEVLRARSDGCSYITVSPVFGSASKPGYGPALEPAGLAALLSEARDVRAFALGGVGAGNAAECLRAGAHGIAVMSTIMSAPDPGAATAELLLAR